MASTVAALFAVAFIFWKILNAPIVTLALLVYVSNRVYRIEQRQITSGSVDPVDGDLGRGTVPDTHQD